MDLQKYLTFKVKWTPCLGEDEDTKTVEYGEEQEIDCFKYGIVNFFNLSTEPVVDYFFKRNGKEIPIYKTYKIIGTVIAKNDTRSSVDILTTNGVVTVKFTKEYFAMFNRQISEIQEDGTKKVKEKGWFSRGNKIMVTGFRREDTFVAKAYKHTPTHQLYKITEVFSNGEIAQKQGKTVIKNVSDFQFFKLKAKWIKQSIKVVKIIL